MIGKSFCAAVLSAAALLVLVPGVSEAQVRFSVGVGVGRGWGGYPGGFYGGFGPYYRGVYPGYRGVYPGVYPGFYGYPRSGISIGIGGYPYGYGYPASIYTPVYVNRYYTPFVGVAAPAPYYTGSAAAYSVQTAPPMAPATEPATTRVDNTALIELRVPTQAKVWFDGTLTTQTGANRRYVTPDLTPGYDHTYAVKATWTQDGKEVSQERKVIVQAGHHYFIDLTGEALPQPKPVPQQP